MQAAVDEGGVWAGYSGALSDSTRTSHGRNGAHGQTIDFTTTSDLTSEISSTCANTESLASYQVRARCEQQLRASACKRMQARAPAHRARCMRARKP